MNDSEILLDKKTQNVIVILSGYMSKCLEKSYSLGSSNYQGLSIYKNDTFMFHILNSGGSLEAFVGS